jgi:hypothetical protein
MVSSYKVAVTVPCIMLVACSEGRNMTGRFLFPLSSVLLWGAWEEGIINWVVIVAIEVAEVGVLFCIDIDMKLLYSI